MMTTETKTRLLQEAGIWDMVGDAAVFVYDYLDAYGWLDGIENVTVGDIEDAVGRFQDFTGGVLLKDSKAGPKTLRVMQLPRCGHRDVLRQGDPLKWGLKFREGEKLLYRFESYVPRVSQNDQRDIAQVGMDAWAAVAGVDARPANSNERPNLVIGTSNRRRDEFGVPGGVLAWCEMLMREGQPTDVLRMMFDMVEPWYVGAAQLGQNMLGTFTHEVGHCWGMDHDPESKGLMQAFARPDLNAPVRGSFDEREMKLRYGDPLSTAPVVQNDFVIVTVNQKGVNYRGKLFKVTD